MFCTDKNNQSIRECTECRAAVGPKLPEAISGGNAKAESTLLFVKCTNREGCQGAADGISAPTSLNHNPPRP